MLVLRHQKKQKDKRGLAPARPGIGTILALFFRGLRRRRRRATPTAPAGCSAPPPLSLTRRGGIAGGRRPPRRQWRGLDWWRREGLDRWRRQPRRPWRGLGRDLFRRDAATSTGGDADRACRRFGLPAAFANATRRDRRGTTPAAPSVARTRLVATRGTRPVATPAAPSVARTWPRLVPPRRRDLDRWRRQPRRQWCGPYRRVFAPLAVDNLWKTCG